MKKKKPESGDGKTYLEKLVSTPPIVKIEKPPPPKEATAEKPSKQQQQQQHQPVAGKGKTNNKPQGINLESLIDLALRNRQNASGSKNQQKSAKQSKQSVSMPSATTKETKPLLLARSARNDDLNAPMRTKVRLPRLNEDGVEIARKKKKMATLKKKIIRERKAEFWLNNPMKNSFPLFSHPALIEHDCIWLGKEAEDDLNGEEPMEAAAAAAAKEEEEEEEDVTSDEEIVMVANALNESHDEAEEEEEEVQVMAEEEEDAEATANERKNVETKDVIPFDSLVYSPIYFGCNYIRTTVATEQQGETNKKKEKIPKIQNRVPVRDYITQAYSKELDDSVSELLSTLFKFQERARLEDPIKAKTKRRLVFGFHETLRGVKLKKCTCVIIATDVENAPSILEQILNIVKICKHGPSQAEVITTKPAEGKPASLRSKKPLQSEGEVEIWEPIPVVYCLKKLEMGRALGIKVPVSIVGIYSGDGAFPLLKQVISLSKLLTGFYAKVVEKEKMNTYFDKCVRCGTTLNEFQRFDCRACSRCYCMKCYAVLLNKVEKSEKLNESFQCGETDEKKLCSLVKILRIPPPHLQLAPSPIVIMEGKDGKETQAASQDGGKRVGLNPTARAFEPKDVKRL